MAASAPKLQPALMAGAVLGVLSALPVVNVANCCCVWFVTAGVLAAWLMQQESSASGHARVTARSVGLLAGLVGSVVWAILYVPIHALTGTMSQRMVRTGDGQRRGSAAGHPAGARVRRSGTAPGSSACSSASRSCSW